MAIPEQVEPYLPTAEEIRQACERIQGTWSNVQRVRREVASSDHVRTPVYALRDASENAFFTEEPIVDLLQ
jgi:hypothetical protein